MPDQPVSLTFNPNDPRQRRAARAFLDALEEDAAHGAVSPPADAPPADEGTHEAPVSITSAKAQGILRRRGFRDAK